MTKLVELVAIFLLVAVVVGVIAILYNKRQLNQSKASKKRQKGSAKTSVGGNGTNSKEQLQSTKSNKDKGSVKTGRQKLVSSDAGRQKFGPTKPPNFVHPWLASTLKGPTSAILDLDCGANDKLVASCSIEDRTVMIWGIKNFMLKDNRAVRVNVEFDTVSQVKFDCDGKNIYISTVNANNIECFKITKKPDGHLWGAQKDFEFEKSHTSAICGLAVAKTGKFLLSRSADTKIILWTPKGKELAVIDTHQVTVYCAVISPCGRFIGSSGFTPDVKIWLVEFAKQGGDFHKVSNAYELKGHSAGVESIAFNEDATRIATISKDHTWKLWDTKVDFKQDQDPYLLRTETYKGTGPAKIAISPDGKTIVVGVGKTIQVHAYEKDKKIPSMMFDVPANISGLTFDNLGKFFMASADRHIHIFHNVCGYKIAIRDLQAVLLTATNKSMKERIQKQIDEAQLELKGIHNE